MLIQDALGALETYVLDPHRILRQYSDILDRVNAGEITTMESSHPAVNLLEAMVIGTLDARASQLSHLRQVYPVLALTPEDLVAHLSDADLVGRWALPGQATVTLVLSRAEVINALVMQSDGTRRMTIPRHTTIRVAGISLSLCYAVEIIQPTHGGLRILFDDSQDHPLQVLQSNMVDYVETSMTTVDNRYLALTLPVKQFEITSSSIAAITRSTAQTLSISFANQFVMARAFMNRGAGWEEIDVSYHPTIYDATKPCVQVIVASNLAKVGVPTDALVRGLITGALRVDIYSSQGNITKSLAAYSSADYEADWTELDPSRDDLRVNAFRSLNTQIISSADTITSGRDELTFEVLRERVLANSLGRNGDPVTPAQLEATLQDMGFKCVRHVDLLKRLVYLATRNLPDPADTSLLTAAPACVMSIVPSLDELALAYGVRKHLNAVTITPQALFSHIDGRVSPLTLSEQNTLSAFPAAQRCDALNSGSYLYTPFYYVLDSTQSEFRTRVYQLDRPEVILRRFETENQAAQRSVAVTSITVNLTQAGYEIRVAVRGDAAINLMPIEHIQAWISFLDRGNAERAYLQGVCTGLEETGRVFVFTLATALWVDAEDCLEVSSPKIPDVDLNVAVKLTQDIDLVFSVYEPSYSQARSQIEAYTRSFNQDPGFVAFSHYRMNIRFGRELTYLWSQTRSSSLDPVYRTHTQDVPAYWSEDVYAIDPLTGRKTYQIVDGKIIFNKLHAKGDVKLTVEGEIEYLHRAGDIMLSGGEPVIDEQLTQLRRHVEVFFLSGLYAYSTDLVARTYIYQAITQVVDWCTDVLAELDANLLDRTHVYYHPRTAQGLIEVVTNKAELIKVDAEQSMVVDLYVPASVLKDLRLRQQMTNTVVKIVDSVFQSPLVSVSSMVAACKTAFGSDVYDVDITGLVGGKHNALTVTSSAARLSLKKKAVASVDGVIRVIDDITVNFYARTT